MGKDLSKNTLGFLGLDFQYKLAKIFAEDSNFFEDLQSTVDQNAFTDPLLRGFITTVKDCYKTQGCVPSYQVIEAILRSKSKTETDIEEWVALLNKLKFEVTYEGYDIIKEMAIKFFKQQNLIKVANKILEYAGKGDIDRYEECQRLLEEAAMVGQTDDLGYDIYEMQDKALSNDYTVSIPTGIEKLDEVLGGGLDKGKIGLLIAPAGFGKALSENERVFTENGFKLMKEIKVGDYVIGSNGKKVKVLGVYPQGKRDIYKVKFSDGTSCRCDMEHLWNVNSYAQRTNKKDKSYKTMTLNEILAEGLFVRGNRHNFKIPVCKPVEFNKQEVKINPYLLGYMIGDGSFSRATITCGDEDINEVVENLKNKGYNFNIHEHKNRATSIDFFADLKRDIKLYYDGHYTSENKFIPKEYLYNDIKTRVEIFNGLMDSDGTAQKNGTSCFNTKSKQLAEDVRQLVLSLGGFCKLREKKTSYFSKKYDKVINCGIQYELTITLCDEDIPIFKMKRKQDRVKYRKKYSDAKYIDSVEFDCNENAICIKVDAEDELFLTNDYIVTHNTSFTTAIDSYAATYRCDINNNQGFKVLQIYFEDDDVDITRKHYARILSEGQPREKRTEARFLKRLKHQEQEEIATLLNNHADKDLLKENLRLKKFKTGTKSATDIGLFVKRLINSGFKPDLISIDYFECLAPEKGGYSSDSEWTREGVTMRVLENLAHELNCAIWVPTQGTKDSMNSPEVVRMDQASGSAKKVHVAQLILSIARAIGDIDKSRAVISILKNRSGKSGKIFNNVYFDNGTCTISCDEVEEFDDDLVWKDESEKRSEKEKIDLRRKLFQAQQELNKKQDIAEENDEKNVVEGNFVGHIEPNKDFE